jgi:hypothetical protein
MFLTIQKKVFLVAKETFCTRACRRGGRLGQYKSRSVVPDAVGAGALLLKQDELYSRDVVWYVVTHEK